MNICLFVIFIYITMFPPIDTKQSLSSTERYSRRSPKRVSKLFRDGIYRCANLFDVRFHA